MEVAVPELICHDVLQYNCYSSLQFRAQRIRPMFNWFKYAVKRIDRPMTLAVLASGIDEMPEWTEFIRQGIKQGKFKVECHGWEHRDYKHMDVSEVYSWLLMAKEKLEATFKQPITRFFPPRMRYRQETKNGAEMAGLTLISRFKGPSRYLRKGGTMLDFHYWVQHDIDGVINCL